MVEHFEHFVLPSRKRTKDVSVYGNMVLVSKNTHSSYLVPFVCSFHSRSGVTPKCLAKELFHILPYTLLFRHVKSFGVTFAKLLRHLIS